MTAMRRAIVVAVLMLGFVRAAEALTVRDIVELSRAGLGDEVLLALIDVNRGVYAIDPETLKTLKQAGVSDRVIAALVRSGRETLEPLPPATPPDSTDAAPPVVVVEHHGVIEHYATPQVQAVTVPVPVYVTAPVWPRRPRTSATPAASTFVPFQFGPPPAPPVQEPKGPPVYWGFGGKLRPDAWQPEPEKPARRERESRRADGPPERKK
jgi:hypothetical protein